MFVTYENYNMSESNHIMTDNNENFELRYKVEDTAMMFFDLAEKLEAIRVNNIRGRDLEAILDTNMYLWRYALHYIKSQFWMNIPQATIELIDELSNFMIRAGIVLKENYDDSMIRKMIHMNIRMCNQIIDTLPETDTIQDTANDFISQPQYAVA